MNEKEIIARIWFKYAGNSLKINQIKAEAIEEIWQSLGFSRDELAKIVVENVIGQLKLSDSKLIHVTPAGGWNNVLALQYDLFKHNVLGVGKNIISILDGDIKEECNSHTLYKQMPKRFLPISCIEKYLKSVLIDQKNTNIYKRINDSLFQLTSLNEVISDYKNKLMWEIWLNDENDPLTNLYIYIDAYNGNIIGAGKASD